MIEKLTPEQEAMIQVTYEKWEKEIYKTYTEDYDSELLTKRVNLVRENILEYPTDCPVLVVDNPLIAFEIAQLTINNEGKFDESFVEKAEKIVEENGFKKTNEFIEPYIMGNYDSHILGYYDYMINVLKIEIPEDVLSKYNMWCDLREYHYCYIIEGVTVVSRLPTQIHIDEQKRLHCEGGPALVYRGGVMKWSLHGVEVPRYLAETPSGELTLEFYKTIQSADVKAEFIRKFGVERMLGEYGVLIDTWANTPETDDNFEIFKSSEYELWDMAEIFEGIDYAPHLKMKNQTTGIWHVEGVHPDCRTVQEASDFRWGQLGVDIKNIK